MTQSAYRGYRNHNGGAEHMARITSVGHREKLPLAQTAYILATALHESRLGLCMLDNESGWAYEHRHDLGNTEPGDGPRFRARGYVPIVGRIQYTQWERKLAVPLVADPDLAAVPEIAAEIAVRGMVQGTFTGHRLAEYINDSATDYLGARRVVNGQDRAVLIAGYARDYEAELRPTDPGATPTADVMTVQRLLRLVGWPLVVDGIFGTYTRRALQDFQSGYTFTALPAHGLPDEESVRALSSCAHSGGYVSPHFRFREFRTGGSLKLSLNNRAISVQRPLVHAMERYRSLAGRPVEIASGYRSLSYNQRIDASATSQHLVGRAVDLWRPRLPVAEVAAMGAFTAIGTRHGVVVHLEVADEGSLDQPLIYTLDR